MNARDFLRQYKTILIRIKAKKEQIKRLREMAEYVSPGGSFGVHGVSTGDKIGEASASIADIENDIKADMKALAKKRKEIMRVINSVDDSKQKKVLKLRYINCLEFSEIARKMNYSLSMIYKIHENGLENLHLL